MSAMNGFVSYSHDDYGSFQVFQTHLRSIERAFSASFWADKRIHAGAHWNKTIQDAIDAASVFILLLSPGFIASDYIYDHEIPAIGSKHLSAGALVLPVVLKRCSWQMVASALQAIPSHDGRTKPIVDWVPHNHGYDRAREQIANAINMHFGLAPTSVDWTKP
ncbi:toll/interleukin-1 receptor domain-containing protein [Bradyrhizobium sp. UFLA01-814]|uniref:TIR domain-containing protein n=1 Tax=Bradyrhizobium sp. UFLA01-814 TaxID=3023480 RepID=UPI00398A577B